MRVHIWSWMENREQEGNLLPGSVLVQQQFDKLSGNVERQHALRHLLQNPQLLPAGAGEAVHPGHGSSEHWEREGRAALVCLKHGDERRTKLSWGFRGFTTLLRENCYVERFLLCESCYLKVVMWNFLHESCYVKIVKSKLLRERFYANVAI